MNSGRANALLIQTPEGILFPLLLAGPVTRFLAWIIDVACVVVLSAIIGILTGAIRLVSWDIASAITVLSYFVISIGYPMFTEWHWRGQTLGKRLLRLRVMDVRGLRLQFSQIAIRNLLRFIDMLPALYTVGGLVCLLNRHFQRLGDIAANTIVVRSPEVSEPDLSQELRQKYNSFREYPHLMARLRQRVSPQEAGIALQALLRREKLEPQSRMELFGEIAAHFKHLVPFPPEASEGLADEQYIRNVVDILFRKQS